MDPLRVRRESGRGRGPGRWSDPPTAVLEPEVARRIVEFGLLDGDIPTPRHPESGGRVFVAFASGGVIKFEWTDPNPRTKSAWYQLAVSTDVRFETAVRVFSVLDMTSFPTWLRVHRDHYFWRVRTLQLDSRPGPWSPAVPFQVIHDPDLHAPPAGPEPEGDRGFLKTVRRIITRVTRRRVP